MADYLHQVAAQHPAITELIEIGRTTGNRPIQVLVVSTLKKGAAFDSLVPLQNPRVPAVNNVTPMKPYMGKPGQWIDGGAHGLSLVGTEVCLYVIDKLVSGYGSDAEVTKLVDDNVFYICPVLHADAAPAAAAPRAESPTPANGNYPEGWWTDDDSRPGGTGTYPSSSAEARAVLEFFTNHTNILFVQSFHTNGGAAVRPFARWPDSRLDPRDAAVFDRVLGKKYLELIGEAVPASWSAPPPPSGQAGAAERQVAAAGTPAGGRRGAPAGAAPSGEQPVRRAAMATEQAAAWRSTFNQERQAPGAFGAFADWAYGQFGAYTAVSIQAWDAQRQVKPVPGEGLAELCERHWQFEKYKASLLPHVAITDVSAKVLYTTNQAVSAPSARRRRAMPSSVKKSGAAPGRSKVVQVTATVTNGGSAPDAASAQGRQLRGKSRGLIVAAGQPCTKITFLAAARRWMRSVCCDGTSWRCRLWRPAGTGGRSGRRRRARGGAGGHGTAGAVRLQRPGAVLRARDGNTRR